MRFGPFSGCNCVLKTVSTSDAEHTVACSAEHPQTESGAWISRIFFFVVWAGLVAVAGGMVMLGVFPPTPQPHAVEKVVPNDRFSGH